MTTAFGRCSRLFLALACFISATSDGTAESVSSPMDSTNLAQLTFDELLQVDVNTVYGVSKYRQEISQAPASVSIITEDEIKKLGYRTLGEALRSVRGLSVNYDRNYTYLGVRGVNIPGDYGSRNLVLVDGHRMNDNIYDSVGYGTDFPIDIDLIERIEVIRGPSSSIYGNNALLSVINVINPRWSVVCSSPE